MMYQLEMEFKVDGRWIAEIVDLLGALSYGTTEEEARASVLELAMLVRAGRVQSETDKT